MKTKLNWFKTSVGLALALGTSGVMAQSKEDALQTIQKTEVIVVQGSKDTGGIAEILETVSQELDKAKVSEEIKARILNAQGAHTIVQGVPLPKMVPGAKGVQGVPSAGQQFRTILIRPTGKDGENYRIGIACQQADDDSAGSEGNNVKPKLGLRIETILEDSPAEKAGIKKGDILLAANAKEIKTVADLMEVIQESGKNEKAVTLELLRDEKPLKIEVMPIKMSSSDVEMDNIQLALPSGGFVMPTPGDWAAPPYAPGFRFAMPTPGDSSQLKKEIDEIKSEISEIKKMLQGLIDRK